MGMRERIALRHQHLLDCEAMQAAAATMLKIVGREAASAMPESAGDDA